MVGGGAGDGIYITSSSEGNEVYKNNISSSYIGISYNSDSGNGRDRIYYNLVKDSIVNGISLGNGGATNFIEVYNNIIIHNPSENNVAPYTGHGLVIQGDANRSKFANNLVIVEPDYPSAPGNSNGISISSTTSNIVEAFTDYNHVQVINTTFGYAFKYNSNQLMNATAWLSVIQADAKIKDLNNVSNQAGSHTSDGDSGIINLTGNNFSLQWNSSLIDAGTNLNFTTDILGNPIYGTPDIGAYEYQPPYILSTDEFNTSISKNLRIYNDGKFRYINSSTASLNVNLSVQPIGGFNSTNYSHFLDINFTSWTSSLMNWSEYSNDSSLSINHVICNLTYEDIYDVYYTKNSIRTLLSTYVVNLTGCIEFNYGLGYSTVLFDVQPYTASSTTPTTTTSSGATVTPSSSQLEQGYTNNYRKGSNVIVGGNLVTIIELNEDSAILGIVGEEYSIDENGEIKVDTDNDGYYDLKVTAGTINEVYARLTVQTIYEEIPAEEKQGVVSEIKEEVGDILKENKWIWILIGSFGILIIGFFAWKIFKKK